ncbi:MAG TPA: 30S ribosomal protein S2, partial [archaeon]|nr:30S ribosomal protein S2 [archaeon]
MQENETQQDAKAQVIPVEKYLETGAHLGTEFKTGFMKKFIFRTRQDGLKIIDIKSIDDRVRAAAKLISSVNPSQLVLVSRRSYGQKPVEVMAAQLG